MAKEGGASFAYLATQKYTLNKCGKEKRILAFEH
jgi:hypothetical protein